MGRKKQNKQRQPVNAAPQKSPTRQEEPTAEPQPSKDSKTPALGFLERFTENWGTAWFVWVVVVSIAFLVLKMFTMNAYVGDEHIYLFQGKLVSLGKIPYRDFAMAHPPLQSVFTAVIFKLFGYHFVLGRMLPVTFALLGGLSLSVLVRREAGAIASVVALALVFFAYEPLRSASHYTGVNMTWALMIGALLAYRTDYLKTCAVLCVAAVFTRLYAAPFVAALVIWSIISDWRKGVRIIAWGAGIGVALVVLLCLWAGFDNTYDNLLGYHANKTPMKPERLANDQATVLFHNAIPALFFVLSLPVLFASAAEAWNKSVGRKSPWVHLREAIVKSNTSLPFFAALFAGFFVIMLTSMDRVWMYYFVPAFPLAAISGGWAVSKWFQAVAKLVAAKGHVKNSGLSKSKVVGGVVLTTVFALLFALSPRLESNLKYWKKNIDLLETERTSTYNWKPGLLPDFLNELVKATLWSETRTIGKTYFFYNYYLWHESRVFDKAHEIADAIQKRTGENDCIFGDSGSVPLLALLSDRCIAANEVDTNIQRFRSGMANPDELIEAIDKESTQIIVLRPRFGVASLPHIKNLIQKKYRLVRSFKTAQKRVFRVYERN